MRPDTRQNLADARSAAEEVLKIAVNDWAHNRTVALAVERLLMIIGEAFVRIRSSEPLVLEQFPDAHKLIGMRNVLVHGYDALDTKRIQVAIEQSIPQLLREIDAYLGE